MTKDAKFSTFDTETLPNKVAKYLLEMIVEGKLKPGEKLPPERDLANMMNVGRTSLRGALRALEMMNVVEIRQGSGVYITSLEPERLVEHLEFVFRLDDSTILQLFYARRTIEVGLVRLAATKITDEEIAELDACLKPAVENPEDDEIFHISDVTFHNMVSQIAENPFLERCFVAVAKMGMAPRIGIGKRPGVLERATKDHVAILDALKAHNPELAEKAMVAHLNFAENNLRELLIEQETRR